jgi:hypothetical protein
MAVDRLRYSSIVVMATRGRGGVLRSVTGSVAGNVVNRRPAVAVRLIVLLRRRHRDGVQPIQQPAESTLVHVASLIQEPELAVPIEHLRWRCDPETLGFTNTPQGDTSQWNNRSPKLRTVTPTATCASDTQRCMTDTVLMLLLLAALIVVDVLAYEFGADSRKFRDPWGTGWPGF